MAPDLPLHVRIVKPINMLGGFLTEIRSWLDSQKIEPASFKTNTSGPYSVVFDIAFTRADEARLFKQAFAPEVAPAPVLH